MDYFPVFIKLKGQDCLVVGAGDIAARKIELLARAGGLSEYAKKKDIKIIRKENGKTLQFAFNYKEAIQGKNLKQNIMLQIGDVVLVP